MITVNLKNSEPRFVLKWSIDDWAIFFVKFVVFFWRGE